MSLSDVQPYAEAVSNEVRVGVKYVYGDQLASIREPSLYGSLAPVEDAGYNRGGHSRCHPDTRKDVIADIVQWVKRGNTPICWLNGPPGSGKSAIAQSVAEDYASEGRLAASFFSRQGAGGRSEIARIIPTLAYQLSRSIPETETLIQDTLKMDPSITEASFSRQIQRLISQPFSEAKNEALTCLGKPMIIVIDALDECDDKHLMAEFIDALIRVFQGPEQPYIRVIVTSRIEEPIRMKFESEPARSMTYYLALQAFDAGFQVLHGDDGESVRHNGDGVNADRRWCCRIV